MPPFFISLEYIVDDETSTSHAPNRNYHCDWKVAHQEAMKILKQLRKKGEAVIYFLRTQARLMLII